MKIAIVGCAPSSVMDAPYNDTSWQIWSLGANYVRIPRFNKWFEIHSTHSLKLANALDPHRLKFLQSLGKDLYVGFEDELFPNGTMYPKDEIVEKFGRYFTSSIAWMIGLAIHQGATEIGVWGVDMVGECEYSHQRACCEHLLGIAKGMGIKVTVSPHSPLLRAERLYAFEYTRLAGEVQLRIREAKEVKRKAEERQLEAVKDIAFSEGMLANLLEFNRRWG